MNLLASMSLWHGILIAVTLLVCLLLILVVLLQKNRGGGLAGAFGGAGGGGSAFGAKTGDVFTVITVALAFVFLSLNVVGNWVLVFEPEPETAAIQPSPAVPPSTGAEDTAAPGGVPTGETEAEPATGEGAGSATPAGGDSEPPPQSAAEEGQS
jgi:preprotein translocase subunit SecG